MANIYLIQVLCPLRHCIVGLAFNADKTTEEQAKLIIRDALKDLKINPWCGICGSTQFIYEACPTKYKSVAEMTPDLIEEARKNAETRQYVVNLRRMAGNN